MFIYTGKLQWQSEGVDELLVVVLPNGPARVEDDIFSFSQWTHDSKKNKKVNWSQRQPIDKVTRADNGDDIFNFGRGWYKYEVQAPQGYQSLSIRMFNPGGGSSTMILERTYQSGGQDLSPPGPARIWTGKLNWPQYADNEPFMAIVPEGFGPRKPILAFWQWTVDKNGQAKVSNIYTGTQAAETPASDAPLQFSLQGEYTLKCAWDAKTEKLSVHMEGPEQKGQEVGPFDLAQRFNFHSHDLSPPTLPGERVELEVHYPRAQPTLARIQAALPFPPTLVETLSQTASFVDQAGYLAKYAVDRYNALDKSYHALLQQIDTLNGQVTTLTSQTRTLTADGDAKTQQINELQAKLTSALDDAARTEASLTAQVQALQKTVAADQTHDAADHAALETAQAQARAEQEARAALSKQTVQLQAQLAQAALSIQQFQTQLAEEVHAAADLKGQLAAETAHNEELARQVQQLQANFSVLQDELVAARKTLATTADELKQARADSDDKDKIIEGLEDGLVAVKKDRDAKKAALEALQVSSAATIKELQDEVAKLKADLAAAAAGSGGGGGSGAANWPFQDGWPFQNGSGQGGCWPTPDDLLKQVGGAGTLV